MDGTKSTEYEDGPLAENNASDDTDYLNLHTYDFYDFFILIFVVLLFGLICLIIGCLWNKYLMRKKLIELNDMEDIINQQNNFENKYSNKSFGPKSTNSRIEMQERQQLSPKGIKSHGYNVSKVNEEDGTIEIAVDLDALKS